MRPIRKYARATIYFKNESKPTDVFELCLYPGYVVYYDNEGNERTIPMYFVREIVNYWEDNQVKNPKSNNKPDEQK